MNRNVVDGAATIGLAFGSVLALGGVKPAFAGGAGSTVTSEVRLYQYDTSADTWGAELGKTAAGAYVVEANQTFGVQVWLALSGGYFTENSGGRTPETRNQPLGLRLAVYDLFTNGGPISALEPVVELPGSGNVPPRWAHRDMTPPQSSFPWVNLLDFDRDGDLDPVGAGFYTMRTTASSVAEVRELQFGIDPSDLTEPATPLFMSAVGGLYRAGPLGGYSTTLQTSDELHRNLSSPTNQVLAFDPPAEFRDNNEIHGKAVERFVHRPADVLVVRGDAREVIVSMPSALRTDLGPLELTEDEGHVAAELSLATAATEGAINVTPLLENIRPNSQGKDSLLVVMKLIDTDPAAGPGLAEVLASDPAFLATSDPRYELLSDAYPFLATGDGAIFELTPERVVSFDFSNTGGLKAQFIAVPVPESGIGGALAVLGLAMARRRR